MAGNLWGPIGADWRVPRQSLLMGDIFESSPDYVAGAGAAEKIPRDWTGHVST